MALVLSWVGVFEYLTHFKELGYIGAFAAGLLWPFTFLTPIATASFFYLGQASSLLEVIVPGVLGALLSDLFIWRFFKGGIFDELEKIWENYTNHHPKRKFTRTHRPHLIRLFHSRPFHFINLFLGVTVLFSPLPDEIGLEMLAYYKLGPIKFVLLSITSSVVAIWLVTNAGRLALG